MRSRSIWPTRRSPAPLLPAGVLAIGRSQRTVYPSVRGGRLFYWPSGRERECARMARKRAPRPVSDIAEEAARILDLDAEPVEFEADDFEEPPVKPFYQGDRGNIRGEHTDL